MNTWVVVASVWAMFAVCVVLFVRGASPHVHRSEKGSDKSGRTPVDPSRTEI
ncbi:hypothetical protein [Caballeronia cordobensis]|uniref:Uncharacterized protein n=1 Tax=Caballeronia cordobensis TaxID=1353886 RepID=A0A158F6M6_CABCO|nr:hypothetical protein [Caballeronia cordobensis]BAO87746.1 uncharacterized protein BRPE67_ACDS26910 [Burkholderia sp. RPE67]SAL15538.1 hypothetical protein AWB70_00646 [Caballeronia cordobensis]